MKIFNITILWTLMILTTTAVSQETSSDRTQINQTMEAFFKWDLQGGVDNANKALSKTVRYHRINDKGEHVMNTPTFDWQGKGKDAHEHNI